VLNVKTSNKYLSVDVSIYYTSGNDIILISEEGTC